MRRPPREKGYYTKKALMTGGDTLELIHHKAEDLRRKQDSQLQRLLRLATTAPIVALSAGTIAVAVSEDIAAAAAVIVFGTAIALGVVLVAIEAFASGWREGLSIRRLLQVLHDRRPTRQQLQLSMIVALREDHTRNDKILISVRVLVILQGLVTFAGISALLLEFRELA